MKLTQIFQKPVDRSIEGVIKADDESRLAVEVEEYVLTHEISKRLENFLEAYNQYQNANGAWISGFFGSGKSHLLKILSMLLENRSIDGVPVLERFLPKCEDAMLKASLQKAAAIPSRSILFNIDQRADVIVKTQVDALLAVFVKVFDEMCGYYGKQGYIAAFERDMDKRGIFQDFRNTFEEITGLDWEIGREQALLEADNIASAYAQVTLTPTAATQNILDRYRADYRVSIEDFANQVNEYLNHQAPTYRLNFFVDEVGQYIANNIKLMTNLQTIAESLATKCRGRAWIIVTSQQEIKSVIGDMSANQANDFSKIQARFALRMNLTSQNVAEVIQKRLLLKNSQGIPLLEALYDRQVNNFGTLFDFADGSHAYKNFHDQKHFVNSYPFIPYQFPLFQSAIQNLSEHNAFEGKHSSVGERSMLAVFQQVAVQIAGHEVGQLATFDLMFEGIRNAVKTQIQQAVLTAENQLNNAFAVRLLKALFLVKYVKEFKATLHNLSVLMISSFDVDMLKLQRAVESALNLLEQQTYIQRSGEIYEYLTNEEKDVEEEIKNTVVELDAVSAELGKIIFDQIIRDRKIRYDESGQDFSFSRRLDDQIIGKEYETAIHFVSPFHELINQETTLISHSLGREELLVLLPPDNRLVQDLYMFKRTEKYVSQHITITQEETVKRILSDKSFQNRTRGQQLEASLKTLIAQSRLFIAGNEISINSTDAVSRVTRGYIELIKLTYSNLKMLHGVSYQESEIEKYLKPPLPGLLDASQTLPEAAGEMLTMIQANKDSGTRTTLKAVIERFERKRYGWPLAAILCNLAMLVAHAKVEVRLDSNILENTALARALRNTQNHPRLLLDPQVEFTGSQVRGLKEFYADFFDRPAQASEARDLGKETAAALDELQRSLRGLLANGGMYPFLNELAGPVNTLQEHVGKVYSYYLVDLPVYMDELLDMKEQTITPLRSFWNGPQKGFFDELRSFVQREQANFDDLPEGAAEAFNLLLIDPEIYKGARIQQAKQQMEQIGKLIAAHLKEEKTSAQAALQTRQAQFEAAPAFGLISAAQQEELRRPFAAARGQLEQQNLIAKVRDTLRRFEENDLPRLHDRLQRMAYPPVDIVDGPKKPPLETVALRSLQINYPQPWLQDEAQVDQYLNQLRQVLLEQIQQGKRISI